jgi:PAS domain S-box-containing protein
MALDLDSIVRALPSSGTLAGTVAVPIFSFFVWRERSLSREIESSRQEQKELQLALAQRDEALQRLTLVSDRFAIALEAARMAVWETDMTTGRVYRSELHDQIYGYPEGLKEWTHERFMNSLHPEDRPHVQKQVDQILSGEITDYQSVFRIRWPDGQWRWIDSRARVFRDSHGKVQCVRGAILDITELKKTQLELQHAVQVRDEFLSLASHELKTPLTSLLMSVQLLHRKLNTEGERGLVSDKTPALFSAIERQIFRLSGLVDNLLDVARIQGGKLKIEPRRINLSALVREFCERMGEDRPAESKRLSCTVPADLEVTADPLRIEQVLTNLVTNAFKYGNGTPVHLELAATDSQVCIAVSDQGPGIAVEDQARIFHRFEQGQSLRRGAGLGLGLYIVQQIVQEHGGRIDLKSIPGQGAVFTVVLPREPGRRHRH